VRLQAAGGSGGIAAFGMSRMLKSLRERGNRAVVPGRISQETIRITEGCDSDYECDQLSQCGQPYR
jgi:hypothetical protein